MLGYNRTCNIEDFSDPVLRELIRDIFAHEMELFPAGYPDGVADSKQWEVAMAVRTLRDHGVLTRKSRILGVGAGTEITSFYLTRHAGEVLATDIYANAHVWADVAPLQFLADPGSFSPIPYDAQRLVPLHMDARALNFPDDTFDGVFSSGSIEHFGSLEAVANAAYEIGRVLRPGGVATIATEFKVAGPPEGDGWDPNVILFSRDKLIQYIVDASGLELIDPLQVELSGETLSVRRDLVAFLEGIRGPASAAKKIANYPNLILYHEGYLFCSVHLALKKSGNFHSVDRHWAAPSEETLESVRQARSEAGGQPGGTLLNLLQRASEEDDRNALKDRIAALTEAYETHKTDIDRLSDRVRVLSEAWESNQGEIAQYRREVAGLERRLADMDTACKSWEAAYRAVKASVSWRITSPLRVVLGPLYKVFTRG